MPEYEVLLFYKYIYIQDPALLAEQQRQLQERLGLKGRSIIAAEGINSTVEGTKENTAEYVWELRADPRFSDVHVKRSPGTGRAFDKSFVRVRKEIVALGLDSCNLDPAVQTGKRLQPEELHRWIHAGTEFYIVDMRNAYEHLAGHFKGSLLSAMDNFRDLPKFLKDIAHLQRKTVLTVCTGGVRCEKASAYLIKNGFTNVYQLDGGIVSYMERYPNEDFVGKLYVFDNRMLMGFYTDDPAHTVVGACAVCAEPCERYTNCANHDCHRQLIACRGCQDGLGKKFLCAQGCKSRNKKARTSLLRRLFKRMTGVRGR